MDENFTTAAAAPGWTKADILEGCRKMMALPKVTPQAVMCDFGVHLELLATLPKAPVKSMLYSVPIYSVAGMRGIEVIPESDVPAFIQSHCPRL